jgi:hypothetical protein
MYSRRACSTSSSDSAAASSTTLRPQQAGRMPDLDLHGWRRLGAATQLFERGNLGRLILVLLGDLDEPVGRPARQVQDRGLAATLAALPAELAGRIRVSAEMAERPAVKRPGAAPLTTAVRRFTLPLGRGFAHCLNPYRDSRETSGKQPAAGRN